MGRTLKNDYNQYLGKSASTTLHSVPGWVRAIIAVGDSTTAGLVTIYDNTAASGNKLFETNVEIRAPVIIILPMQTPLRFSTGLHVVTDANARAYILTEV